MYAGHFAAGLAIKAREPRAPTWAVLLGVALLDILFGVFVTLGIERVTMTPHLGHGFNLDFIDWSHSLVMAIVWAGLFMLPFWRRGRAVAWAIGIAVFSHFVLDFFMHPPDLALWPGSKIHLGLGLWRELPTGYWWVEFAFIAVCCVYYFRRARRLRSFGGHAGVVCAVVILLHLMTSPWLSPVH